MEPLKRAELLHILSAMGVEIPENSKLSGETLEKRLRSALDASQERDRFPTPYDVAVLPKWPVARAGEIDTSVRPLLEAVRRGNMHEAMKNSMANRLGVGNPPELYIDPFMDLRQTVMSLANALDQGLKWAVIQDPEMQQHAINIRFLHILKLDEKTPAMVLLYRPYSRENAMEGARWFQSQVDANPANLGGLSITIKATLLEQKLLLKLFSLNEKLLPNDFTPEKKASEQQYRATVLLPIGPLGFEAIGKLNNKVGCAICGKNGARRCSQCLTVSYCSAECQRADWPAHKKACRSLKGGRWCTVRFRAAVPGTEDMYYAMINRHSNTSRTEDILAGMTRGDASVPHPNIHGDRLFLVKLQVGLTGPARDNMMVYDRQRSFGQLWISRIDDPRTFLDFVEEMEGPRGIHGLYGGAKMYRWARRTGDWELSICLDRQPETDIKW
ncbi:hypothetical protein BD413DRAFT_607160 [Trametes elegans]|nr:hypothetical protein BD413DRAFT_607160 [Trametes elegans]